MHTRVDLIITITLQGSSLLVHSQMSVRIGISSHLLIFYEE